MVAPTDPAGINKVGSPRDIDRQIDSWGYVHGRQSRTRLFIGAGVFLVGGLLIIAAFMLYRFTTDNLHAVSDDVFRSRELSAPELKRVINENGIKTVIRLVGTDDANRDSYEEEAAVISQTQASLIVAELASSRLPYRSEIQRVFEALDNSEPPILVHCKHGSDRTGLVSTIWLHDYMGKPLSEARKQLAFFPYGHVEWGEASAMGRFLDMYTAFSASNPGVSIKDWVKLHYFEEKPGREIQPWYDGVVYRPRS
ncbi:MAG: tyrosine-protein phosphatase [Planctomycetes bacterium]|nr:tyrosine-protein phosphatase [Planctomycetota bacterium]